MTGRHYRLLAEAVGEVLRFDRSSVGVGEHGLSGSLPAGAGAGAGVLRRWSTKRCSKQFDVLLDGLLEQAPHAGGVQRMVRLPARLFGGPQYS